MHIEHAVWRRAPMPPSRWFSPFLRAGAFCSDPARFLQLANTRLEFYALALDNTVGPAKGFAPAIAVGSDAYTVGARVATLPKPWDLDVEGDWGNGDPFVGSEADLLANWQIDRHWSAYVGYSHFFAGGFLAKTGSHHDIDFAYAALAFAF